MLNVYVPDPDSVYAERIASGSGIVGTVDDEHSILTVDFEGDIYDEAGSNIVTYADRVNVARNRHVEEYPTKARLEGNPKQFVCVGRYDADGGVVLVDNPDVLASWLDVEQVPEEELYRTTGDAARQRYWERKAASTTDPALRIVARRKAEKFRRRRERE